MIAGGDARCKRIEQTAERALESIDTIDEPSDPAVDRPNLANVIDDQDGQSCGDPDQDLGPRQRRDKRFEQVFQHHTYSSMWSVVGGSLGFSGR
jgi:hypothetical protein